MEILTKRELPISIGTLKELFDQTEEGTVMSEYLDECLIKNYDRELDGEYLVAIALDKYNRHVVTKARAFLNNELVGEDYTPEEMSAQVVKILSDMRSTSRAEDSSETVGKTYKMISDLQNGIIPAYWSTGSPKFDQIVAFGPRKIIMIAASKKVGKTRLVIDRMMRLTKLNMDVNIIWYTFEMRPEEVIMNQIAWLTGIDTRILQGKTGKMSSEQKKLVEDSKAWITKLPIKYVSQRRTIEAIERDLRSWVKTPTIVIIDNLGLVEILPGMSDLQHEDLMAKRMVNLRDELDLCLIPIHHLSKESESKWNKEDLYRPKASHVRGSSRLVDYANELVPLHRPSLYKDLKDQFSEDGWAELLNKAEVIVPINRDGPDGDISFTHEIQCSTFTEIE